jgi:hypothetical protein
VLDAALGAFVGPLAWNAILRVVLCSWPPARNPFDSMCSPPQACSSTSSSVPTTKPAPVTGLPTVTSPTSNWQRMTVPGRLVLPPEVDHAVHVFTRKRTT